MFFAQFVLAEEFQLSQVLSKCRSELYFEREEGIKKIYKLSLKDIIHLYKIEEENSIREILFNVGEEVFSKDYIWTMDEWKQAVALVGISWAVNDEPPFGIVVCGVDAGSAADEVGLQIGDVIIGDFEEKFDDFVCTITCKRFFHKMRYNNWFTVYVNHYDEITDTYSVKIVTLCPKSIVNTGYYNSEKKQELSILRRKLWLEVLNSSNIKQ